MICKEKKRIRKDQDRDNVDYVVFMVKIEKIVTERKVRTHQNVKSVEKQVTPRMTFGKTESE